MGSRAQKIAFLVFTLMFVAIMAILNTSVLTMGTSANAELMSTIKNTDSSLSIYDQNKVFGSTVIDCAKAPDEVRGTIEHVFVVTAGNHEGRDYTKDAVYTASTSSDPNQVNRTAKFKSYLCYNNNSICTGVLFVQEGVDVGMNDLPMLGDAGIVVVSGLDGSGSGSPSPVLVAMITIPSAKLPSNSVQGKDAALDGTIKASFYSLEPLSQFVEVRVDGNVVPPSEYDLKEGSIIVILYEDFLATLPYGEHTIDIVADSSITRGSFTKEAPQSGSATFNDGVTLTWEELKDPANGEKYGYDASVITDTSIGNRAFKSCTSLTSITIPSSITSIGEWAFSDCTSLTSVNIPDSVTSISEYAFYKCTSLTSITIPNSVKSIGVSVFRNCTSLTSINVATDNTKYDSRNNCNAIIETATNTLIAGCKNTVIPNGVTSIGGNAFKSCNSLTSVTIPDGVTSIGEYAFYGCKSLTSVTIPDSVKSIGISVFSDCTSLTSINIPDSVTSIDKSAFLNCKSLTSINIPDSVTSISFFAFYNCKSLTSITYTGTKAQWNAITKGTDWKYNVPASCIVHCTDGDRAI